MRSALFMVGICVVGAFGESLICWDANTKRGRMLYGVWRKLAGVECVVTNAFVLRCEKKVLTRSDSGSHVSAGN